MTPSPAEIMLEVTPSSRFEIIDITKKLAVQDRRFLEAYSRATYCSYHTTAGYFSQNLCARLRYNPHSLEHFVRGFQHLFPPNADYRHDQLHLRSELSEAQKRTEPRNADSHLTFISAGLENCTTYINRSPHPVYFIELDGVNGSTHRRRKTKVVGYNREQVVCRTQLSIPVSNYAIDSINLQDPRLGLFDELDELLAHYEIGSGRIELTLAPDERHAGLSVNEFETRLMEYDLADILYNPLRYMTAYSRHIVRHLSALFGKTEHYLKQDLVQTTNEVIDVLGLGELIMDRILSTLLAYPASSFFCMKRSVHLLVCDAPEGGPGTIIQGAYQSPILIQWKKAPARTRRLNVQLIRFE